MSVKEFSIPAFLQEQPYFASLSTERLTPLARQAVRRQLSADEVLFLEGESSAGLWLIEQGRVKVYKITVEGREHVLHLLGPGDTFNDIPALDGSPNAASAMTLTDAVLWVVPTTVLQEAMQMDHELALAVVRGLTRRIRTLVVQIEDLALRSVTGRLARFLLEQAQNPSLSGPAITRALIATHLATTPETVSRALRTLEEAGAISFDRHRIVIRKGELLREIAML
ncbi:MAG TPA: Crp/Fnr family transcriptional regulator [Candidatus Sulfomarinibacteraceae bacterium]|nr:Crp/Fnr family transcriptional regulator [Candidatus Sulfomarinibacteraceae bacterium]